MLPTLRSPESLALASILMVALAVSSLESAPVTLDPKDPATMQRLREMFVRGQTQAINDFYEQKALKAMTNSSQTEPSMRFIPIASSSPNGSASGQVGSGLVKYLIVKPMIQDKNGETKEDDQVFLIKTNGTHEAHLRSDARQSSLFGGFPSGGLGNGFGNGFGNGLGSSSPFGGGLLRPPSLSAFPTLAPFGPFGHQQTRQPKSAIIGNGGGAMALTNDNVVVVNVLSGNY